MWRFLIPHQDGTVTDIAVGAPDLADAFRQFAEFWWRPTMNGAVAVFQNHALVARVIPVTDKETQELQPHLQLWR